MSFEFHPPVVQWVFTVGMKTIDSLDTPIPDPRKILYT